MPPHLRNQGGGSSGGSAPAPAASAGYGGRAGYGGNRDRDNNREGGGNRYERNDRESSEPRGPPAPQNSRWASVENDGGGSGGGGDRDGGYRGGGGGYGGDRRGGDRGGGYGRGGPRVNERGYHGDMRPDARLERRLFQKEDIQTTGINFDNYDDIPVETSGNNVPEPIEDYTLETIGEDLIRNTQLCGYTRPTPVQKYSVPIGTAGRDLMAW